MTFHQTLLNLNFIYDSQAGSYFKEDEENNLHTYAHIINNQWNYEKYNSDDQVISSIPFYTYD